MVGRRLSFEFIQIKGTMLLKVKIDNASAKIRNKGANDDPKDERLPIWSGVLPIQRTFQDPVAEKIEIPLPLSVQNLIK